MPVVLLMVLGALPIAGQEIFVHAGGEPGRGSGLLRFVDGQCYVATANHIVDPGSKEVILRDEPHRTLRGQIWFQHPSPIDLALIRVEGTPTTRCGNWPDAERVRAILGREKRGQVRFAREDGTIEVIEIFISSEQNIIVVWPVYPQHRRIEGGMSGGGIYAGGVLVGTLVSAREDINQGQGYTLDYVWSLLRPATRLRPSILHRPPSSLGATALILSGSADAAGITTGGNGRLEGVLHVLGPIAFHTALMRMEDSSTRAAAALVGARVGFGYSPSTFYLFAEAGPGRQQTRYDAGGYSTVAGADTVYHPFFQVRDESSIAFGSGAQFDFMFTRRVGVSVTGGFWSLPGDRRGSALIGRWVGGLGGRFLP